MFNTFGAVILPIHLTLNPSKMESNQIDMFIITKGKYFRSEHLMEIRNRLQSLDDSKKILLQTLQFHDPTIILVVSLLVGALGIDRFMIGDIGLGVLKLITCGGLGIWAIVDWFLIMGLTKDKNMEKLQPFLY
jgi:TM2 domain-containing membrane protein YozV